VKKHSLGPCVFESLEFSFILNGVSEKPADRQDYGNEAEKISEWYEWRRMRAVGLVFRLVREICG
jgi:hypothetical protein